MRASQGGRGFTFETAGMRLFVAMDVNDEVRDAAMEVQRKLVELGIPGKYELREKIHLTLAFLGSTSPRRLAEVSAALTAAARISAPFAITLDRLGAFPSQSRPRILWLGSSVPSPGFDRVAHAVRQQLARLGWTFDDQATAHATICRLKRRIRGMPTVVTRPAQVQIRDIVLYESFTEAVTSRYEERLRVPLGRP